MLGHTQEIPVPVPGGDALALLGWRSTSLSLVKVIPSTGMTSCGTTQKLENLDDNFLDIFYFWTIHETKNT